MIKGRKIARVGKLLGNQYTLRVSEIKGIADFNSMENQYRLI
jgi:hypothetical protein